MAAVATALMAMGGVAVAAPKGEPPLPEQAQPNGRPGEVQPHPNGLPVQAHPNGLPVQADPNGLPEHPRPNGLLGQAHDSAPASQVKAKDQHGKGGSADLPRELAPQAGGNGNSRAGAGHSRGAGVQGGAGGHSRRSAGETQGQGTARSFAAENGGGNEQAGETGLLQGAVGDVLGVSEDRPDRAQAEPTLGGRQAGGAPESGPAGGSFNGALPFTGFELALLAGLGTLLALAGVRLRRSFA